MSLVLTLIEAIVSIDVSCKGGKMYGSLFATRTLSIGYFQSFISQRDAPVEQYSRNYIYMVLYV